MKTTASNKKSYILLALFSTILTCTVIPGCDFFHPLPAGNQHVLLNNPYYSVKDSVKVVSPPQTTKWLHSSDNVTALRDGISSAFRCECSTYGRSNLNFYQFNFEKPFSAPPYLGLNLSSLGTDSVLIDQITSLPHRKIVININRCENLTAESIKRIDRQLPSDFMYLQKAYGNGIYYENIEYDPITRRYNAVCLWHKGAFETVIIVQANIYNNDRAEAVRIRNRIRDFLFTIYSRLGENNHINKVINQ